MKLSTVAIALACAASMSVGTAVGAITYAEAAHPTPSGHYLNVNGEHFWVKNARHEIPRPAETQLWRYDCLTMGNRKCGPGWRHLQSWEIDVAAEAEQDEGSPSGSIDHPWEQCLIRPAHGYPDGQDQGVTFIDCPDWYVQTA